MDEMFQFRAGETPLLISIPHDGRHLPEAMAARMTVAARRLPDTDWHVRRLYGFAAELGAGVLAATHSRYVVDLNRDPAGKDLYPGADNTEIVPATTFERRPIYRRGEAPGEDQIRDRVDTYWRPYHARLAAELDALKSRFGLAVLFDAHSIRSRVPRFFDGRLTDLNLGSAAGRSADAGLAARAFAVLEAGPGYSAVLNGRFTGGYITRHYGRPADGVHALQLELSQRTYMAESHPFAYDPVLADRLTPVLRRLLAELLAWTEAQG